MDDGRNDEIEPGGPELPGFRVPVGNPALFEGADHLGQGVALLALNSARHDNAGAAQDLRASRA
jgi:hypothetical protein